MLFLSSIFLRDVITYIFFSLYPFSGERIALLSYRYALIISTFVVYCNNRMNNNGCTVLQQSLFLQKSNYSILVFQK